MEQRRWGLVLVVVAAAAVTLAGCSGNERPKTIRTIQAAADHGTFVGKVDGTGANIGLVTKDDRLAGFLCQDRNTSVRFDPVPIEGGAANLVRNGKVIGLVAITDHGATGRIAFAGKQRIFATELATGKAGVYRLAAKNAARWDGWIVLNDGSYTGTRKSRPSTGNPWIDPDTNP